MRILKFRKFFRQAFSPACDLHRVASHLMRFSALFQEVAEIDLKALYFCSFVSSWATIGIVLAGTIWKQNI
jgi:hypothetical protein